jgi:hypothetical protein
MITLPRQARDKQRSPTKINVRIQVGDLRDARWGGVSAKTRPFLSSQILFSSESVIINEIQFCQGRLGTNKLMRKEHQKLTVFCRAKDDPPTPPLPGDHAHPFRNIYGDHSYPPLDGARDLLTSFLSFRSDLFRPVFYFWTFSLLCRRRSLADADRAEHPRHRFGA